MAHLSSFESIAPHKQVSPTAQVSLVHRPLAAKRAAISIPSQGSKPVEQAEAFPIDEGKVDLITRVSIKSANP